MSDVGSEVTSININDKFRDIKVKVVSSLDEMQMVFAIRACVFLGKPGWSYLHTFDANDHCATHLLGTVDGEPAATIRLRWFSEFARFERIAIREEYRSLALLNKLASAALRLCHRKGYDKAGGLTYPELVPFWGRKGAKPCGEAITSEYGTVVPVLGKPRLSPEDANIQPISLKDAGRPDFEWTIYEWEGVN